MYAVDQSSSLIFNESPGLQWDWFQLRISFQYQSFGHTELLHVLSVHTGERLKELWLLQNEIKREDDHFQYTVSVAVESRLLMFCGVLDSCQIIMVRLSKKQKAWTLQLDTSDAKTKTKQETKNTQGA